MQSLAIEIIAAIGMDVEIVLIICSLILCFMLQKSRKAQKSKIQEMQKCCALKPQNEADAKEGNVQISEAQAERDEQTARYLQIERNLHLAFESEDLFQALRCWFAMKKFKQCSPRYLPQMINTMQSCNKTNDFIIMELRDYLWKHPKQRTPTIVNDVLEPLAREPNYFELVNAIVDMTSVLKIAKDARTYEILLTMYAAKQDAAKAQEMIEEMDLKEIEFTPRALVAVMTMALQLGKLEVALKAFQKLKASWDVRSTWAVSPFALQRHKANTLTRLVELACSKRKLVELLPLLEDMDVPEEVMAVVDKAFAALPPWSVTAMAKGLGDSSKFTKGLHKSSKALLRSREANVDSDASTSEGSRSDSEDDSPLPCTSTA